MNEKGFDAVGIGLCAWDTLLLFEQFPGPNEKWVASQSVTCGGGPVPTALAVFSKLGGRTAFIGAVGDRQEGLKIRCDLAFYGVDVSYLAIRPGRRSPCAYIWIDQRNGNRTVALDSGDVGNYRIDELPEELIANTSRLLIDGRDAEVSLRASEICRENGGIVLLDAGSPREHFEALLSVTDHAVVSENFVQGTFPGVDVEEVVHTIAKFGPSAVVVTLGEKGGIWYENKQMDRYDAFDVAAVDTTGAGDAFHGAYLYGLVRGWGIEKRCKFASGVAAIICTGIGGRSTAPTYEEADYFLSKAKTKRGDKSS
jgi:ribokinase